MATRFCAGCGSEVEDAGGFCLLGHRLGLAPTPSQDIQAEIATAFGAASGRMEAAFRLAGLPGEGSTATVEPPVDESLPVAEPRGAATPSGRPPAPIPQRVEAEPSRVEPAQELWGPPPPPEPPAPSQEESAGRWETVWGSASPEDVLRDPITAFSRPHPWTRASIPPHREASS